MDIPSDPCETPAFRRKLKVVARKILSDLFDPVSRGLDREAFIDELIGEAETRIRSRDKTTVVESWVNFYAGFMRNIVREARRKVARDPLAGGHRLDDPKHWRYFVVQPAQAEALETYNQVTVLLAAFCADNAARMRGQGLDPGSFPKLWLRRHLQDLTIRESAEDPRAPARTTIWRWDAEFRRYARDHWNDAPEARQQPERKQR